MKSYIKVKDILQRKHFENIEVIAGNEGISRLVKWVHIVEAPNVRNLLSGGELILSTGVAWKEKDHFISILEQFIEAQAAGLCIEMGTYTSSIPEEVIKIANQFQFPIILFHKEVAFVEITQDIHTFIINHQYNMISNLESYSQSLNKKLLTVEHYSDIPKFIQHFLQVQVIIVISNKEIQFTPNVTENERIKLLKMIEGKGSTTGSTYSIARIPINLLGDQYAELIITSKERELTDFDQLILDRTATALAQFFLRELYVEEQRRLEETEWMTSWLDGEQSEDSISEFLSYQVPSSKQKGGTVCLCKIDSFGQYSNVDLTYFKLNFRTIFEQRGFTTLSIEKRNMIIFIMLNERSVGTWKKRMEEGIERLLGTKLNVGKLFIGVGKYVEKLTCITVSYQTSLETLRIKERLSKQSHSYFYDDLHVFRLISLLNHHLDLSEYVLEYLGPIIKYDKMTNGKLLETLRAYLACNGSKQETAKQLYIVRQTLYHRLEKIEEILGHDFMNHEKRLVIEIMIMSYDFLLSSKPVDVQGVGEM
ncbi:purine catabolism regulator [Cytobacillus oceanisediminis]|uniref:Purine catabolism regulator n=1 Tax=Cytobacillus oceanisediminis TaxID=665099 RepID=A0A2V3A036_9BACI|nr:PucR family transcriptional regulator [Cytobacillus oceanisediminis]PWW26861.1 purine catabolism regulator [Cytobacillus oceanisediminis]